ncbi:MAG: polysaccharide biosynthesis/export family protein [Pseudomonadota bacterium]
MRVLFAGVVGLFLTLSGFGLSGEAFAQSYKLKSGDNVSISVWQDEKLNRQVIVRPDGKVSLPLAGHVRAAGASLETLEVRVKQRLQKFYAEDLDVTAALVSTAEEAAADEEDAVVIYVTGQVRNPGRYELRPDDPVTVLQGIALSGGLANFAAKGRIKVRRSIDGEETVVRYRYRDVVKGRDLSADFLLEDGDVIVVPERGLFR